MTKIRKIDYFVGVFLSAILNSAKQVPALFDESDTAKKVEFETNQGRYNVYVKYSTKRSEAEQVVKKNRKKKFSWIINFGAQEYDKFRLFPKDGYKNLLAVICTNDELTETWIAIMENEVALRCLTHATPQGIRRVKISRVGSERTFRCQGVGYKKEEYESCPFDYTELFEDK